MKLSELFELSPLAYEEAKRETIKQEGKKHWKDMVKLDVMVSYCFVFYLSDNCEMWEAIHYDNDTTLLKEWEAKQKA